MKAITIQLCQSNDVSKHLQRLQSIIADQKHIQLIQEKCLNKCSFCDGMPYVLINRQVIFGDNIEELFEEIQQELIV